MLMKKLKYYWSRRQHFAGYGTMFQGWGSDNLEHNEGNLYWHCKKIQQMISKSNQEVYLDYYDMCALRLIEY